MPVPNNHDRTRLGALLIENGLISQAQLDQAMIEQQASQLPLGQILVGKKHLTERQVRRTLRLQKRLRATVLTSMISVTPLLLQGCGSSAEAGSESSISLSSAPIENSLPQSVSEPDSNSISAPEENSTPSETEPTAPVPTAGHSGGQTTTPPQGTPNPLQEDTAPIVAEDPEAVVDEPEPSPAEAPAPERALAISLPPMTQTALAGDSMTFNVSATGADNLRYQWYRDGEILGDAVLPSLTLSPVHPSDAGTYYVVVSDGLESIQSDNAELTVDVDKEARLNWSAPMVREDGSPMGNDEISGYRVYHSTEDGQIETTYDLAAETSELELRELVPGIHFFAVTTVDNNGLESDLSNMMSKTVY